MLNNLLSCEECGNVYDKDYAKKTEEISLEYGKQFEKSYQCPCCKKWSEYQ